MSNNNESLAPSGFAALQNFNMQEVMQEEFDGLDISFDKIKIPSGGGISFEMPGDDPDNPDSVKEFTGVIVHHHPIKTYYKEKYTGGNAPPDCSSMDGKTGSGCPGGMCVRCGLNEYGTAHDGGNGKGCKDRRRLYILRDNEIFPLLLSLPTGSLKSFTKYITRLMSKQKRAASVLTCFSLSKATNAGGVIYSQAKFAVSRELSPDEQAAVARVSEQVKAMAHSVGFDEDADVSDIPDIAVDPDTGELIEAV